ncbi:beta-2-glycoprotein 1-like isoform X1 [Osmerus eperlanus]|uniref:beta-2-glycoprotein 1-like isoform X1 n=1 Tax=Osmerus eperlanus TaxID=29151 RepID=UPI002E120BD1
MDLVILLLSVWALSSPVSAQVPAAASDLCPDRLLGNERIRTCPKPCTQDKDCGNKRQCLCDGQCGLSCVAPGRSCPWPLPLGEHLEARLLSPTPSFSALLEVRCDPGFTLPNGLDVAIRRCQGDRQWSGDEPICTVPTDSAADPTPTQMFCPRPEDDILHTNGTGTLGDTVQYSCLFGYTLVGSRENLCQHDQTWQHPHPICQKSFCPPPKEVENGYVVAVQKTEYEAGFETHFLCKKNFLLDGPNQIFCLSNGSWSGPPPFCRARCLIPAERSRIVIGGVKRWPYDVTDAMVPHGEKVTFFCKHPSQQCSLAASESCFDGKLNQPHCYLEPTWLQYKLFPHRLVSEIEACEPGDVK